MPERDFRREPSHHRTWSTSPAASSRLALQRSATTPGPLAEGLSQLVTPSSGRSAVVQRCCDHDGSSGPLDQEEAPVQRCCDHSSPAIPFNRLEVPVQRLHAGAETAATPSAVRGVLGSGGSRLDTPTRSLMESRLGHDFGQVRIHRDASADTAARAMGARAFTSGTDVVFANGQYAPDTPAGRHVLAHELSHVVQQRQGAVDGRSVGGGLSVSDPSDRFERAAERTASTAFGDTPTRLPEPRSSVATAVHGSAIQRAPAPAPPRLSERVASNPRTPRKPDPTTARKSRRKGGRGRPRPGLRTDHADSEPTNEPIGRPGAAIDARSSAPLPSRGRPAPPPSPRSSTWVQRYSWGEFVDDAEGVADSAYDTAASVGSSAVDLAEDVADSAVDLAGDVADTAVAAGEYVGGALEDAADWLATTAGQAATALADALGGVIRMVRDGIEIRLPGGCPLDAQLWDLDIPSLDESFMVPVVAVPLGPVLLTGDLGVAAHLQPHVGLQLGPLCVQDVRILINPLSGSASVEGGISGAAAVSLGVEVRGGVRGELGLTGVIPVGGIPVPITVPLIGVEGGLAGMVRGTGGGMLSISGRLALSGTTVSLDENIGLAVGVAADAFVGAYAQLDLLGKSICRIYWQPAEWHADTAGQLQFSPGLSISASGPTFTPRISAPSFTPIPYDEIGVRLSREGFTDDCPILDALCSVLRDLGLLPSQNGGTWEIDGPYGAGPRLPGPLEVYQRNPGRASGALCRGACGPDCETCKQEKTHRVVDPATGKTWEYVSFENCNTHTGCRDHDAAFDWAAAEHGEVGRGAVLMPWHMAANVECGCNHLAGDCIGWIAGLPPYDGKLYFAESAHPMIGGGGGIRGDQDGGCRETYPNAPSCAANTPDRDAFLADWGVRNGLVNFHDFELSRDWGAASFVGCDGGPGRVWHFLGTDLGSGQVVGLTMNDCICCRHDDTAGSEYRQPQVQVDATMSMEHILDLCERGLIPRVICVPVEDEMISRYGNRRRNIDLDPDVDPKSPTRPDDAPLEATFRRIYNRLDSWNIFVRSRHPDLYPEFTSDFHLDIEREGWMTRLKAATKDRYKTPFRDISRGKAETEQTAEEFRGLVRQIQSEIDDLNRRIAVWYRQRTGSTDSIEDIIENVHLQGTELWRAEWRRAILQVNRVLDRLWPPAKTRILVWIGEQRASHPGVDLSGNVSNIDYIGSLATGFKGPPKQHVRFNPDKFDVDANLAAPPLQKYAMTIQGAIPDRGRIFGRNVPSITPLIEFSDLAHAELASRAPGYDSTDPFDVAIDAPDLPVQARQQTATDRLYQLRNECDPARYSALLGELRAGGFLNSPGNAVRDDLTEAEFNQLQAILDRHAKVCR
jgi:Domain of unknown function (DUF4157)